MMRQCLSQLSVVFILAAMIAPCSNPLLAQETLPIAKLSFTPHEPAILAARHNERELPVYFTLFHMDTELEKSHAKSLPRREGKVDLSAVRVGGRFSLPLGQAIDFSENLDAADMGVVGTTGYGFLKGKIVQIDFSKGQIAMLAALPKDVGQEFRIQYFSNGQAYVQFKIGDESVPFMLSSFPNRAMYLTPRWVKSLTESGLATVEELTETVSVSEKTFRRTFRQGVVKAITCGDVTLMDIPYLEELDEDLSAVSSEFLCQFIVTVEASQNHIFLKRRVPTDAVERRIDLGGAGWIRRDGKAIVVSLVEKGVLERAGIELRDEMVQINGEATKGMTIMRVRKSFIEPGASSDIKILRNGKVKDIRITLPGLTKSD